MKSTTALHLSHLAARLALAKHPGNDWQDVPSAHEAAQTIHELHRLGVALQRRYEAACSYEWANTPAYQKRTDKLEAKLLATANNAGFEHISYHSTPPTHGLYIQVNTDPRGWPVILTINGRTDRVGGEV